MSNFIHDYGTLAAIVALIIASVWVGTVAQRLVERGSFMKSYFLGGRGLGAWALALTATVQSGGTFVGYPALVYQYGWCIALWIASYMIVPITGFALIAKRLAGLSRKLGAITIPDLFRERFRDPRLGLASSLLILFMMTVMIIAQFKAGATVMQVAWPSAAAEPAPAGADATEPEIALSEETYNLDSKYYVGLALFTVTVVGYTIIGGFLAAVWTDLLQSVIMWIGVMILLPLVIWKAGGLAYASESLRDERPVLSVDKLAADLQPAEKEQRELRATLDAVYQQLKAHAQQHGGAFPPALDAISAGVTPSINYLGEGKRIDAEPRVLVALVDTSKSRPATADKARDVIRAGLYSNGKVRIGRFAEQGSLLTLPGAFDFLPLGVAISFFFHWVFTGLGSPASVVRVMASKSTSTIRRSLVLLSVYNLFIYLPLIAICICGRVLLPDLNNADAAIPQLAVIATEDFSGGRLLAGLILAAPFGAVMATVSSFLVVIASGLVRDVYQRFINPRASTRELKLLSYTGMLLVGAIGIGFNIRPINFLQTIVVFSSALAATAFVTPLLMTAYWRRANGQGALAAMIVGFLVTLTLYFAGWWTSGVFRPLQPLNLFPLIWGLGASALAGIVATYLFPPPPADHVSRLFDAVPDATTA